MKAGTNEATPVAADSRRDTPMGNVISAFGFNQPFLIALSGLAIYQTSVDPFQLSSYSKSD